MAATTGGWEEAFFMARLSKSASSAMVQSRIQIRQTAITALLTSIFVVAFIMQCFTVVTGYCLPTSGAVDVLALPHAIFLMVPFVVSYCGLLVFRFEASLNVDAIQRGFYIMYVLSILGALAFLAEFIFSLIEVIQCKSIFCTANGGIGYLVAEIIAEGLFIGLHVWLFAWTYLFARDWDSHGKRVFLSYKKEDEPQQQQQQQATGSSLHIRASLLKK